MPTDWPLEAVKAQSVAARSYAYRSLRPGSVYDVFADTRSQMYGGVLSETPAGNRAVTETGNLVVRDAAGIAQTFFFSTSGGRTAAVEEVWRSDPIAYLKSVEDPYDHISPYHTWEARLSDGDAQRKLRSVLSGELEAVEVASTTPSGRAATVKVVGTRGERTVDAATIRTLLGLRSTWFSIE
jgi:stage II sporulation protein D